MDILEEVNTRGTGTMETDFACAFLRNKTPTGLHRSARLIVSTGEKSGPTSSKVVVDV